MGHDFGTESILQWHGYMPKGLEAARQEVAPQSARLSDLAHVLGATSQSPAGLPGLVGTKLGHHADPTMRPFILQWSRLARHMTAYCFSFMWKHVFKYVENAGHRQICAPLQLHYFYRVQDQDGRMRWDAAWRAGPDRINARHSSWFSPSRILAQGRDKRQVALEEPVAIRPRNPSSGESVAIRIQRSKRASRTITGLALHRAVS